MIEQWSQSAEAQPFLQQAMAERGASMPQQGGMGGYGAPDPYMQQINSLISANPNNPKLQEWLLKLSMDYSDPRNQQTQGIDENLANIALSLMSSDKPEAYEMGISLLKGSVPQLAEMGDLGGYGESQTYEDVKRQEALGLLEDPSDLSERDFEWNKFLSQATDEQVREYLQAKENATFLEGGKGYWKGTGIYNPFDSSFWNKERAARAKMGYK